MSTLSPQLRFLLRGSLLLVATLSVWWLILLNPLLFLLRVSAELPLGDIVTETSGDWTFTVRVEVPPRVRTIEFTVPRSDIVLFTFSLPVYWAIILAAPAGRKAIRAIVWGSVLVSGVQVLALVTFVTIIGHGVVAQMHPEADAFGRWYREFGNYLAVNVVPPAAPFLIALSLHRELRSQIFTFGQRMA